MSRHFKTFSYNYWLRVDIPTKFSAFTGKTSLNSQQNSDLIYELQLVGFEWVKYFKKKVKSKCTKYRRVRGVFRKTKREYYRGELIKERLKWERWQDNERERRAYSLWYRAFVVRMSRFLFCTVGRPSIK